MMKSSSLALALMALSLNLMARGQSMDSIALGGGTAGQTADTANTAAAQTSQAAQGTSPITTTAVAQTTVQQTTIVTQQTTAAQQTTQPQAATTTQVIQQTTTQAQQTTAQQSQVEATTSVIQVTEQTTVNGVATTSLAQGTTITSLTSANIVSTSTKVGLQPSISFDPSDASAIIVVANVTTTVAASQASSAAAILSSSIAAALQSGNASSSNSSTSSNAKDWAIPLGVVGGVVAVAIAGFLFWKLRRRRFSGLDDEDAPIRWPELKASDDNSFLMPAEVRHVQGAGVDFGTEDGDNHSMAGDTRPMSTPRLSTRLSGGNGDMSSVGLLATIPQQYYDDPRQSYYDPYSQQRNTPTPEFPYPPSATSGSTNMTRQPSNMSMSSSAALLPPGASTVNTTSHAQFHDEARVPYDSAEEIANPYLASSQSASGFSSPNSYYSPAPERSGTVRSAHSAQRLAIANPSNLGEGED